MERYYDKLTNEIDTEHSISLAQEKFRKDNNIHVSLEAYLLESSSSETPVGE